MITVALIDDDKLVRMGLKTMLPWKNYNMAVVGEAQNGKSALDLVAKNKIDLVFIDLEMPGMFGIDVLKRIKEISPNTQCVILTMHQDFSYIQKALRLNVLDYIIKAELNEGTFDEVLLQIKSRFDKARNKENVSFDIVSTEEHSFEITQSIQQAIDIVSEDWSVYISTTEIAKRVHMSRSYFCTCFKHIVGTSFHSYCKNNRIEYAKQLLLTTKKSITSIAVKSGFTDEKYFSSVFKTHVGKSPSDFRKNNIV